MRPQSFVLFPMDHLLFLSQRRHQPFATRTALPAALTPTGASLPSVGMPLFTSSYSSSTTQTSMESTCLSFNLRSLRGSRPGIRSLKVSPIPLACLLALRGVCPWRLPAAQAPQPFPWHPALGWLLLPPSLLTYPPRLLGTRTHPQPIPESPRCRAHPQHGGVVLLHSWRQFAMSFEGAQVFSAWHPPPLHSWQMLPHFSLEGPGDSSVSTNSFLQACTNLWSSPYCSSCGFSSFRFTPKIFCISSSFIPELQFLVRFRVFPFSYRLVSLLFLATLKPV